MTDPITISPEARHPLTVAAGNQFSEKAKQLFPGLGSTELMFLADASEYATHVAITSALAAQSAEVAAELSRRDALITQQGQIANKWCVKAGEAAADRDSLRAEVQRLREALETIRDEANYQAYEYADIAREALNPPQKQ